MAYSHKTETGGHLHKLPLTSADLVHRNGCYCCGGLNTKSFSRFTYNGSSLSHFRCQDCGHVFMNPAPSQEWYDKLYKNEFWSAKPDQDSIRRKTSLRVDKFFRLLNGQKIQSFLDVGAGYGHIAEGLADRIGAKAYIVEPSLAATDYVRRNSTCVLVGASITDLRIQTKFDLIMFSHCLENIIDPSIAISAAREMLSENGMLLIETPNVDWQPSMHIYHPHCYSPSSATLLLSRLGMQVTHMLKSGEPTTSIVPRYLTVLSRKGEARKQSEKVPSERRVRIQHTLTGLALRLSGAQKVIARLSGASR